MKYTKRFGLFISAILLIAGSFVATVSAQRRVVVVRRPVIVTRPFYSYDPFWRSRYWMGDSFYNDYYWNDPFLAEQRERYYKQKSVKDAAKDIEKDKRKYAKDGVITAEEREKLDKQYRKYNEAVAKLQKFDREH